MMLRFASMAACLALAAPLYAQADELEDDGEVNLDAIDSLFGDDADEAAREADDETPAEEDELHADDESSVEDTDIEDDGEADDSADAEETADDEDVEEEGESEEPEISDLTRAFNSYSLCASEAGAELEEQDFAIDQIGQEALLRCGGQRAAYINAFYFDLLPRYPESTEAAVRESAERLVTQSDAALMNLVTAEVRQLRNARPESSLEIEAEDELHRIELPSETDAESLTEESDA